MFTLQASIWWSIHYWIQSCLSNHNQRVIINGTSSSPVSVTSSMPQGTVLGPLLFLAHINDLPDHIKHSTVRLFTDDCILHRHIQCDHIMLLLQEDNISFYVCGPLHGKCILTQISIVHEHHNCINIPCLLCTLYQLLMSSSI